MICRHILILISMLTCALFAIPCHGLIKVYSVSGNVSEKQENTWVRLAKGTKLDGNSTVRINAASELRLLDNTDRRIYTFSHEGTHIIANLIAKAKKENSTITDRIVAETARRSASVTGKSHQRTAAAFRATMSEEQLEALYTALCNGFKAGNDNGTVRATLIPAQDENDSLYTIQISNNSPEDFYVNLFMRNADSHWQCIFTDNCIFVPAQNELHLTHMPCLILPSDRLVLVAYAEDFDTAELDAMLAEDLEPEAEAAQNVQFFFLQ